VCVLLGMNSYTSKSVNKKQPGIESDQRSLAGRLGLTGP
jgi:hypothetical protein